MEMETYLIQLEQINMALEINECPNRTELTQLKDDLLELIRMLQTADEVGSSEQEIVNISDEDSNSSCSSTVSRNFAIGAKCKAPFSRLPNSSNILTYHNAIIFEIDDDEDDLTDDKQVKVMFCNPLTKSMQPCPYFLNGTCNFENKCRFSHGETVLLSQLKEYEEPDFENVKKDTLCLVKQEDDLWKLGRVTDVSREESSAAVCLVDTNEEIHAPFDSLLPLTTVTDDLEVLSDDDHSDLDLSSQASHHAWRNDSLGGWEKHTKGVASKLMVKMGYVPGQGLGRESDGRLEPVEAKILPKGKSLDKCLEQSSTTKDPLKVIKLKKRKEKLKERRIKKSFEAKTPSTSNVFDIINDKLKNSTASKHEKSHHSKSQSAESFRSCTDKELNIKLVQIQEKIRGEERNRERYQFGVERNETRDKLASRHVKSKLNETEKSLSSLKEHEKALTNEITNRKNEKKFCQF